MAVNLWAPEEVRTLLRDQYHITDTDRLENISPTLLKTSETVLKQLKSNQLKTKTKRSLNEVFSIFLDPSKESAFVKEFENSGSELPSRLSNFLISLELNNLNQYDLLSRYSILEDVATFCEMNSTDGIPVDLFSIISRLPYDIQIELLFLHCDNRPNFREFLRNDCGLANLTKEKFLRELMYIQGKEQYYLTILDALALRGNFGLVSYFFKETKAQAFFVAFPDFDQQKFDQSQDTLTLANNPQIILVDIAWWAKERGFSVQDNYYQGLVVLWATERGYSRLLENMPKDYKPDPNDPNYDKVVDALRKRKPQTTDSPHPSESLKKTPAFRIWVIILGLLISILSTLMMLRSRIYIKKSCSICPK